MGVALEYQGERHFFDVLAYGERQVFDKNDPYKAVYCGLNGVRLIEVPYWWDMQEASLRISTTNH